MLALRRLIALIIDCMLLLLPFAVVLFAVFLDLLDWNQERDIGLYVGILLYFSLFECLAQGQTPGKQFLSISVQTVSGRPVGAYESFSRITVLLCAPVAAQLILSCVEMSVDLEFIDAVYVNYLLLCSCLLIWPVSIIIGRGRMGVHDLLFGTIVVRSTGTPEERGGDLPRWKYLATAALVTIAISIGVASPLQQLFTPIAGVMMGNYEVEHAHFLALFNVVMQQNAAMAQEITNWPEYATGEITVTRSTWQGDASRHMRFDQSPGTMPINFEQLRPGYKSLLHYSLGVTPEGFLSGDFQHIAANLLGYQVGDPTAVIRVSFFYKRRVGRVEVAAERDVACIPIRTNPGAVAYIIAEPDNAHRFWLTLLPE